MRGEKKGQDRFGQWKKEKRVGAMRKGEERKGRDGRREEKRVC